MSRLHKRGTTVTNEMTLFEFFYPTPTDPPCSVCKAKRYDRGRFFSILGMCKYCAEDRNEVYAKLREDRPEDLIGCQFPPCSPERIQCYADRVANGLAVFSQYDLVAVEGRIKKRGAPDWQRKDGETGVERSGNRWRARPAWRGRKWMLGNFSSEDKAVEVVREWWKDRKPLDFGPAVWIPCVDEDKFFAIEKSHVEEWQSQYPNIDILKAVRLFKKSLVGKKRKTIDELWPKLISFLENQNKEHTLTDMPEDN